MCEGKKRCERPKEMKGDPAKCSPEQIRKCHGDAKEHLCARETRGK